VRRINCINLLLMVLFALFAAIAFSRAWVCDDDYITFRTVDNFVNGYGLTWNVSERVQAYTHPLWMFLLSAAYVFTREPFWTSIVLSLVLSLATVSLFVFRVARSPLTALFGLLVLTLSNAFADYTTSGLENPLTHLLLAAFFSIYLGSSVPAHTAKGAPASVAGLVHSPVFVLSLCAAMGGLNRLDTLLLYIPPLVYVLAKPPVTRPLRDTIMQLALGLLPLVLWELFSLLYYGFLFPNTAPAKLATGIPARELIVQGAHYLSNALQVDPITPVTAAVTIVLVILSRDWRSMAVVVGIVLYLLYLVCIGGDFASGRLLTAPFFCAVVLLSHTNLDAFDLRFVLALFAVVIVVGASAVHPTFHLGAGDVDAIRSADYIDDRGIADERMWYYLTNSLARASRTVDLPNHRWKFDGLSLKAGKESVVVDESIGMVGYYAGPEVHIVDQWALADPLLARLPAYRNVYWRIGHFDRVIPRGYLETLRSGENQIADRDLAQYYGKLALIVRGQLFDLDRLVEIWHFNKGRYDRLIDFDFYRYPHLVRTNLTQVDEPRLAGAMVSDPANTPFYDHGIEIDLGDRVHAVGVELSLDSNDVYQLVYLDGNAEIAVTKIPAPLGPPGLAVHRLDVPPRAVLRGYDRLRIFPLQGDDTYALGHIALQ
jgi:arabinofuranosyltransferase